MNIKIENIWLECNCGCSNCNYDEHGNIEIDNKGNLISHNFSDIEEDVITDFVFEEILPIWDLIISLQDEGLVDYGHVLEKLNKHQNIKKICEKLSGVDYFKGCTEGELLQLSNDYVNKHKMDSTIREKISNLIGK